MRTQSRHPWAFLALFLGGSLVTSTTLGDEPSLGDPFGKPVIAKNRDANATKLDKSYDSKIQQRIEGELTTTTSMTHSTTPLSKALASIAQAHQIPIVIDKLALEKSNIDPESSISIDVVNVSLRSALKLLLADLQLTYVTTGEALRVTTKADALRTPITIVYVLGPDEAQNGKLIDNLRKSLQSSHRDPMPRPELKLLKPASDEQSMRVSVVANHQMQTKVGDAVRKIRAAALSDLQRLQGEWELVTGENNGQSMAEALRKKGATRLRITFAGNLMKMTTPDGRSFDYHIKLDPTQNPKSIDTTPVRPAAQGHRQEEPPMPGIYGVRGDQAVLCLANDRSVGRPEKFKAPKGSRASFLMLQRVEP